ncbi:MAG TPA: transposase [Candidatus Angelobacter sp.]
MSKPARNSASRSIETDERTFFVSTRAEEGKFLLQSDRMATLFIDVLRLYVSQGRFVVNEFVVMPNHVHLIITVNRKMSNEKAVQLNQGEFFPSGGERVRITGHHLAARVFRSANPRSRCFSEI